MAKINPKLNLNKTPQIVDNNSFVFAKNIKLLQDMTITGDSSIDEKEIIKVESTIGTSNIKGKLVGEIVGVNNKIYFFVYNENGNKSYIYEYDELIDVSNDNPKLLNTNWNYNGGEITGCTTINNTNEVILTICEYNCPNNILIPIKHINLSHPYVTNESLYTQSPEVPLANLSLIDYYTETIPNGVYQFFIRYKIAYEHYTNWFPCSRELYIASISETNTALGTLRHITPHTDSNKSFVFSINYINESIKSNYTHFQLGFIISHDNASNARIWKEFPISYDNNIYFSYKEEEIKEISIEEITDITYDLYNVGNITSYRNKLYVSNYTETDFNKDISVDAKILLKTETSELDDDFEGNINVDIISGTDYAETVTINNEQYTINDIFKNDNYKKVELTTYDPTIATSYVPSNYRNVIDSEINNNRFKLNIEFDINALSIVIDNDRNSITINPSAKRNDLEIYLYDNLYNLFIYDLPFITDSNKAANKLRKYIDYYLASYVNINQDKMRLYHNDNTYKFKIRLSNQTNWITLNKYEVKYHRKLDYIIQASNFMYHKYVFSSNTFDVELSINENVKKLIDFNINTLNTRTLLPFTTYDFYIHYVTLDGSILNGIYIGSKTLSNYLKYTYDICTKTEPGYCKNIDILANEDINDYINTYKERVDGDPIESILESNSIIYPIFKINHNKLENIVGWFISVYKHNNNVAQGFSIDKVDDYYRIDCIESDTLLYNLNNNITILNSKGEIITDKAKYYSSGNDNLDVNSLGNVGFIAFKNDNNVDIDNIVWIKGNNIIDDINNYDKILTKITPIYSTDVTVSTKDELNLPGFLNVVKKPSRTNGDKYFISSQDVFKKGDGDNTLTEVKEKVDNTYTLGYTIHSNFNLSLLNLTSTIQPIQRNYKTEVNNQEVTKTQLFTPINSLISSTIYNHESTYYEFSKRTYVPIDTNKPHNIINYENTVRSSNVDADESHKYIYRFHPNSYYNVPTNRGKIVKLFTILNNIYAHCEHGLFAFINNKQLNTNNQSVGLYDSDIFDIGIQEVLDSQYGYAGILNKEHTLITKDYYIFYDSIVKTIYLFDGNNKIIPISDSIKKVIEYINPTDILFADDFDNNRFYINIKNENGNVCLTYSFISKSFVSIHDIDFDKSFNSRSVSYFIKKSVGTISTVYFVYKFKNKSIYDSTTSNIINYGNLYKKSLISVKDENDDNKNNPYSVVDIIYNSRYEAISVLNYINWICQSSKEFHTDDIIDVAEENRELYCGNLIRVYSDQTYTPLLSIENNPEGVLHPNSALNGGYMKPSYNCGIWTFNYLRNTKPNDVLSPRISDNDSYIYGKYFVVRFIFKNKYFKLENIIFNTSNYDKV